MYISRSIRLLGGDTWYSLALIGRALQVLHHRTSSMSCIGGMIAVGLIPARNVKPVLLWYLGHLSSRMISMSSTNWAVRSLNFY